MSNHVTGQQARELLDGASAQGPWHIGARGIETTGGYDAISVDSWSMSAQSNLPLAAAAPDLAGAVAWLYGREADEGEGPDESKTYYGNGIWHIEADPEQGVSLSYELYRGMTPDEAVSLARALLAAAEDARQEDQS